MLFVCLTQHYIVAIFPSRLHKLFFQFVVVSLNTNGVVHTATKGVSIIIIIRSDHHTRHVKGQKICQGKKQLENITFSGSSSHSLERP